MEKLYVLYDARCGLCSWAKRWLMQQPAIVPLSFIPAGSVLAGRLFPGLCQPGDPEEELVVVSDEGGVYREGNAWIMCLFASRSIATGLTAWRIHCFALWPGRASPCFPASGRGSLAG